MGTMFHQMDIIIFLLQCQYLTQDGTLEQMKGIPRDQLLLLKIQGERMLVISNRSGNRKIERENDDALTFARSILSSEVPSYDKLI